MTLHIVCPHCHATNRVPNERLTSGPNCGACHRALFTASPVEITEAHSVAISTTTISPYWSISGHPGAVLAA